MALVIFSAKKDLKPHDMNHSHTNELKGVAILMVLFSHIGYFLFSDHTFLYPLSVAGGVGVNIFLFLSGFGLTSSEIKSNKPILHFYFKRLRNIFIPMWLTLTSVLLLDAHILNKTYSLHTILQGVLGFFPNSDIDSAINSPLWYFTLILFYYLIFPLAYIRNKPYLSSLIILLTGFLITRLDLPVSKDVLKLYQLHYLAFPLGMAFANAYQKKQIIKLKDYVVKHTSSWVVSYISYFLILILSFLFAYTAIHSNIGKSVFAEQITSMFTMLSLVLIFLIKDVQSDLLIILGKYSYEIYLIQWPLLYRFDLIYNHTPAFLGTFLYILFFFVIGFVLNKFVKHYHSV
ncbi:MAG: acyltransferase [Patescibacteria group bacterium]